MLKNNLFRTIIIILLTSFYTQQTYAAGEEGGGGFLGSDVPTPVVGTAAAVAAAAAGTIALTRTRGACTTPKIKIIGPEQTVLSFQTSCGFDPSVNDPSNPDIPDVPARAFIFPSNMPGQVEVQLIDGSTNGNYRSVGYGATVADALANVKRVCTTNALPNNSDTNALPQAFYNNVWLNSTWYTGDGHTIFSMVHNEFDGFLPQFSSVWCSPGPNNHRICWYPNIILAKSTDGGQSYQIETGSTGLKQLAIVSPYQYVIRGGSSGVQQGFVEHSNIIHSPKTDGYYYILVNSSVGPASVTNIQRGVCLFRNKDIGDPSGWLGWDGNSFSVSMNTSPYATVIPTNPPPTLCAPIFEQGATGGCSSVTFSRVLHEYLALCHNADLTKADPDDGSASSASGSSAFTFRVSPDLIHWSRPVVLENINFITDWSSSTVGSGVSGKVYESLLDPTSSGNNFEFSSSKPYLYYTRLNARTSQYPRQNRDLVRVPLRVSCSD